MSLFICIIGIIFGEYYNYYEKKKKEEERRKFDAYLKNSIRESNRKLREHLNNEQCSN